MGETNPEDRPEPQSRPQTQNECFLCGRKESGTWHYSASLGRFVCDDCYRRAMAAPPPALPGRSG